MMEIILVIFAVPAMALLVGYLMGRDDVNPDEDEDYYK